MPAFYSEFDSKAAAWLRELIKQGLIADGVVDERDLWDVAPADLAGFTQVHLCAGIGVWSYALRRAGWPDDRPVWTGSFPCQPFSSAGKGAGFADERHLWPAGRWLTEQCRPGVFFGEQVASKDAEPWLDLVQADLEGLDYAFGACAFPSAGIGAPHIRDRTYWVADAGRERGQPVGLDVGAAPRGDEDQARERQWLRPDAGPSGDVDRMADDDDAGLEGRRQPGRERAVERPAGAGGVAGGLALADGGHAGAERQQRGGQQRQQPQDGVASGLADPAGSRGRREQPNGDAPNIVGSLSNGAPQSGRGSAVDAAGPTNGLWRDADWLLCRDGKWRPVEPGTFPLAHGAPARVGRLRGYGNAVNSQAAQAWIEAYLEARGERAAA